MQKFTLTYEDLDGVSVTEDLWFHLTKTELTDHYIELTEKFNRIKDMAEGIQRPLTETETFNLLDFAKFLIQRAYGQRDRKAFIKTEDVFNQFRYSPAYDAFLWHLFNSPHQLSSFINGLMPSDLVADAQAKVEAQSDPDSFRAQGEIEPEDTRPLYVRENRRATQEEFKKMSSTEQQAAFAFQPSSQ